MVTLTDALSYSALGWCVIPMKMATKTSAIRWKRFQTRRPSDEQLGKWFNSEHAYGQAVNFGETSGGVASRDFDEMAAYEHWAADHPDLAKTLRLSRRGAVVTSIADSLLTTWLRSVG